MSKHEIPEDLKAKYEATRVVGFSLNRFDSAVLIERIGTAEVRNRVLEEALQPMMDFLRHAEWDSHSTEAHVGNLVEQARAALEDPCTKQESK